MNHGNVIIRFDGVSFEHFYGRPVNEKTMKILDDYSKKLIDKTVKRDNGRFVDESKK
jgi:hypothetical protein